MKQRSEMLSKRYAFVVAMLANSLLIQQECMAESVLWNTFDVYDFGVFNPEKPGLTLVQSGLPYAPGIAFAADGGVDAETCFNADGGGSYWVYSFFGDTLLSFAEYQNRELAADVNYTTDGIVLSGTSFNGHEDTSSSGHTFLAVIGFNDIQYDDMMNPIYSHLDYYGWVEMDGMTLVASAITSSGPIIVGTGNIAAIPEPHAGLLLLLGLAGLALRRPPRL